MATKKAPPIIKQERGWVGHFICGNRCRYRRNTLISLEDRHIVISSVGGMFLEEHEEHKEMQTIGHNRFYETMIFRGYLDGGYIEADVMHPVNIPDHLTTGLYGETVKDLPEQCDMVMDAQHDLIVDWVASNFESAWKESNDGF